jgi:hypothetical protein
MAVNNPIPRSRPKVLVAGLDSQDTAPLNDTLGHRLDLRFWRPNDTKDQLRSIAKLCSTAFLLPLPGSHDLETILRSAGVQVIKHNDGPARLRTRLLEMQENGMFSMFN